MEDEESQKKTSIVEAVANHSSSAMIENKFYSELVEEILTTGLTNVVKTLTTSSVVLPTAVTFSIIENIEKSEVSNSTFDDPQQQQLLPSSLEEVISPIPVRGGKLDELSIYGDIKQDDMEKLVIAMERNLDQSESMSLHLDGSQRINSTLIGGESSYEFKMDDLLMADEDLVDQSMFSEKEEAADEQAFNIENMKSRAATLVQHINPDRMSTFAGSQLGVDLIARAAALRSERGSMASMTTAATTTTAAAAINTAAKDETLASEDEFADLVPPSIPIIQPPPIATPLRPRAKSFTSDPMSPSKSFRSDQSSLDAIEEQQQQQESDLDQVQRRREDSFDTSDVDRIASVIPFGSSSPPVAIPAVSNNDDDASNGENRDDENNNQVLTTNDTTDVSKQEEVEQIATEEKKEEKLQEPELERIAADNAETIAVASSSIDDNGRQDEKKADTPVILQSPIVFDDGRVADCKPFLFLSSLSSASQQKAVVVLLISLLQQGLAVTVDDHLPQLEEDIETLYLALLEGKRQLQQFAIEQSTLYQADKKDYGDLPIKYLPTDTRLNSAAQKTWLELLRGQERLLKGLQTVIYHRADDLYRSAEDAIKRLVDTISIPKAADKAVVVKSKTNGSKKKKGLGLPDLIDGLRSPHKLLDLHPVSADLLRPNHHYVAPAPPQHNYSPQDILEERARPRSPLLDTNNSSNNNHANNKSKGNDRNTDKKSAQSKKNSNTSSNQQSTNLLHHDMNTNPDIPWHVEPQRQVDLLSTKLQQSFSSLVSLRAAYQEAKRLRENADRMLQRHVEGQLRRMKKIAADLGKEEQAKLEVDGQPIATIDPVYLKLQDMFPPSPKAKSSSRKNIKSGENREDTAEFEMGGKVLYSFHDTNDLEEEGEQEYLSDMSKDDVDDFKLVSTRSPSSPSSPIKDSFPILVGAQDEQTNRALPSSKNEHDSHNHNSNSPASGKGEMPRFHTLRPATLQLYPFHNPFVDAIHGPVSPYSHSPFTMPEPYEEGTVLMHFADYHPLQQHALRDHKQSLQTVHLRQDHKAIKKVHRLYLGLELADQHFAHRPQKEEEHKPPSVSEIRTALRRGLSQKHIQAAFGAPSASTVSPTSPSNNDDNGLVADADQEALAKRRNKKKKDMAFLHVLAESTHKPSKVALKQETIDLYDFSPRKIRHVVALTPGVMLHPTHDDGNNYKDRPKSASSAAVGQRQAGIASAVGRKKKKVMKKNASFFEQDPETNNNYDSNIDNDDNYNAAEDFSTGNTKDTEEDLQAILLLGQQQLASTSGGLRRINKSNLPPIPRQPQPVTVTVKKEVQEAVAITDGIKEEDKRSKLVSQSTTNLLSAPVVNSRPNKANKMSRPMSANNATTSGSRLFAFLDQPPKKEMKKSPLVQLQSTQQILSQLPQSTLTTPIVRDQMLSYSAAVRHHPPAVTENSLLLEVAGDEGPLLWTGDDFGINDIKQKEAKIAKNNKGKAGGSNRLSKKDLILDDDNYQPFHLDKLSLAMTDLLSPLGLHPSQPLLAVEDAYSQLQEVMKDEHATISVYFSVQQLSFLFEQLSQAAIQLMKAHVSQRMTKMLSRSSLLTVESELELVEQFLHQCLDYTRLQEAGVLALPVDLTAANLLNPPHSPIKSVIKGRSLKLDIQTLIKFEGEPAIKRLEQKLAHPRAVSPPFRYGIPFHDDEYYVRQDLDDNRPAGGGQHSVAQQQGVPRDTLLAATAKSLTEQQLEYYLLNLPRLRRQMLSAVVDRGELILAHTLHPLLFALGMEGKQVAGTMVFIADQHKEDIVQDGNEEVKQMKDKGAELLQIDADLLRKQKQQRTQQLAYFQESSSILCSEWISELPVLPSDCTLHEFEVNKIEKKLRILDRWNSKLRLAADDNVHRAKETSQLLL